MSSILIHNAEILSFHDSFVRGADSMVVEGNKIHAIGSYEELQPFKHFCTKVIDAQGKTLMPGFNDTHIHLWKVGNLKTFMLDVRGVKSKDELLAMLVDYNNQYPEAAWITARGFNEAAWEKSTIPTKDDLDKVSITKPVYVIRTCAHIAVANTKALQISHINKETPVPPGGEIRAGSDGNPNGIFSETALGLITQHIPPPTKAQLKTMVLAARDEMYGYGITAATDPAVDPLLLEAYYEMSAANELGFRLHAIPIILPDGGEAAYDIPDYYASSFFNVNTVKFFSDGGLSGKTAALKRHYKDTTEQGVLRLKPSQYLNLCTEARKKNLSIATHAIGDAAIEFVIDSYKKLQQLLPGPLNRIEHLGLPQKQHLGDMAQHNIAASMQTIFLDELGKNFIKYLDDDYLNHCYPVRSVLENGILTALSSDAPVVKNFNPLKGIESAVTRKDAEGNGIAEQEGITIKEALKAYTKSAAAISRADAFGSLAVGKLADFILLNKNPLQTPIQDFKTIKVEQTFINGVNVWQQQCL